jgi:hypothetical protein
MAAAVSEHTVIRTSLMHGTVRVVKARHRRNAATVRSRMWDGYVHDPVDRDNLAASTDAYL